MDYYTAHKILRMKDHVVIEIPGEIGPREHRLIKHYRRVGPHLWILVIRGGTPDGEGGEPPVAWGDDTW